MLSRRIQRIIRHFPENGLKVLLEDPHNVRELLDMLEAALSQRIDFAAMRVSPSRFVHRDYRHLEADVVLQAPLLDAQGRRLSRPLTIYILIEHQSEPDAFMIFRVLEYVVLIFKRQLQEWTHAHGSADGFRFAPVLPVVLYSGTRTWEGLGRLVDLVAQGELVEEVTPALKPLFLNVGSTPAADLEGRGGAFGWLLRLVQQRRVRKGVFARLLEQVVQALNGLADLERERWLELLSYVDALV